VAEVLEATILEESLMYKNFKNTGNIEIVAGYKKKADHKDLITISRFFAQKGDSVTITTDIHFKDEQYKEVFGALIGTKYERKCPDLIINGKFYEYESYQPPFNSDKLYRMFSRGLSQSSNIIVNNNKGASHRFIKNAIGNRIRLGQAIDEVWVYEKGKATLFYKKQ